MDKKRRNTDTDIPPYTNAIDFAAKTQRWITEAQETIVFETVRRDQAIYAAYGSGRSVREIGRYVGISHTQVKNIIDRCLAVGLVPAPDDRDERFDNEGLSHD
jgi:hypothetical protein